MEAQRARRRQKEVRLHGPVPMAQHIVMGNELRRLREGARLKQSEAADLLGVTHSKLSRNETGVIACQPNTLLRACQVYDASAEEKERLFTLLREATQKRWWQSPQWRGLANPLFALASLEEMACRIKVYDPRLVPGLTQTEQYAYWVMRQTAPENTTDGEIRRRVKLQMERQERFDKESSRTYIAVLDELCLSRSIGPSKVMIEQLEKILTLADDPRYSFRLLRTVGSNLPWLGPTVLIDFEPKVLSTVLYEDRAESALICQEPADVDQRMKGFDRLLGATMATDATKRHIWDYIKSLRGGNVA